MLTTVAAIIFALHVVAWVIFPAGTTDAPTGMGTESGSTF